MSVPGGHRMSTPLSAGPLPLPMTTSAVSGMLSGDTHVHTAERKTIALADDDIGSPVSLPAAYVSQCRARGTRHKNPSQSDAVPPSSAG